MNKSRHLPLEDDQKHELELMLKEIPTETIVHTQWNSPEGQTFVKKVRTLQLSGVSLPTIAEHLDVQLSTLQGAVRYWERPRRPLKKPVKGVRQRRPLGRGDDE